MTRPLIASVCAAAVSGCSLFATQSPRPPPQPPECSASPGPPILDGLVTTVATFTSLGFGLLSVMADKREVRRRAATNAGLFMVTTVVFGTSTVVGGVRVRRCKKAHVSYELMQRQAYPPPPP